jgi:hypothetical protein
MEDKNNELKESMTKICNYIVYLSNQEISQKEILPKLLKKFPELSEEDVWTYISEIDPRGFEDEDDFN